MFNGRVFFFIVGLLVGYAIGARLGNKISSNIGSSYRTTEQPSTSKTPVTSVR